MVHEQRREARLELTPRERLQHLGQGLPVEIARIDHVGAGARVDQHRLRRLMGRIKLAHVVRDDGVPDPPSILRRAARLAHQRFGAVCAVDLEGAARARESRQKPEIVQRRIASRLRGESSPQKRHDRAGHRTAALEPWRRAGRWTRPAVLEAAHDRAHSSYPIIWGRSTSPSASIAA